MKRWLVLVALVLAGGLLCFAAGRLTTPAKIETVEIPGEIVERMVPVEVVKTIETPGPERVVERVRWKTTEVPIDREVIRDVFVPVEGEPFDPEAFVEVKADKFHGLVDGELRQGWVGHADCLARRDPASVWQVLASSPIDNTESVATTDTDPSAYEKTLPGRLELRVGLTTGPGLAGGASWYRRGRRWGLWAGLSYEFDPWSAYDSQTGRALSQGSWAASGGVSRRFGRR